MLFITKQLSQIFGNQKLYFLGPEGNFNGSTQLESPQTSNHIRTQLSGLKEKIDTNSQITQLVEDTNIKIEALLKMNKDSKNFYESLDKWLDGGKGEQMISTSDIGGLYGIIREGMGENTADKYQPEMEGYRDLVKDNRVFNKTLTKLLPKEHQADVKDKTLLKYIVRDLFIMFVFHDLPLFDLRLNSSKRLESYGIPMDKASAFTDWVRGGMNGTPDYSKKNLDRLSGDLALQDLGALRANLIFSGLSENKIDDLLVGKIDQLTDKEIELVKTILNNRILPDLEKLNAGGFNIIESMFDDKDNKIESKLRKLKGKKYKLDFVEANGHDITLQKIGRTYILEVDDWGTNTHKVFNSLPTKKQIERSIKQYLKSDKIAAKYGWREYDAIYSNNNNFGFDEGNDTQQYEILRLENDQVMLKIDGRYKVFDKQPTDKQLKKEKTNKWNKIEGEYLDNNLSFKEIFSEVGSIIDILKEQDKEGRWFSPNNELTKGINRVSSRVSYTKNMGKEFWLIKNSINILKTQDNALYKRYSILGLFASSKAFKSVFPSRNSYIDNQVEDIINSAHNPKIFIRKLKSIDDNPAIKKYFLDINNTIGTNGDLIKQILKKSIYRKKYNKDISSTVTLTFPITVNLLKSFMKQKSTEQGTSGGSTIIDNAIDIIDNNGPNM